jgi:mRNA interferase RelE/StbE
MRHEIVLAPEAVEDLWRLTARSRALVRAALEQYLRHEPTRASRSRIKRLRDLKSPEYRLRVGTMRVYYDVRGDLVEVLAVIEKADSAAWLAERG